METIKLKRTAHQNPSIFVPGINESANRIMIALITIKNKPNVIIVNGMVRMTNRGLSVTLNNASTPASIKAAKKPST